MVKFSTLSKYNGIFEKAYLEVGVKGFSVFDQNNVFIGFVRQEGFLINRDYPHKDKLTKILRKRDLEVFDYDMFYEQENEKEIAELLYGKP